MENMKLDIKKINPIVKVLSSMILAIVQTNSRSLCARIVLLLVSLVVSLFTNSKFKIKIKSIILFVTMSFLSSLIFTLNDNSKVLLKFGFISLSESFVKTFTSISTAVMTFWIISVILLNSISSNEISYIVNFFLKPFEKFNVNVSEISMVITLAIRFMPVIINETNKIMIAQESRGASISRGSIFKRVKYIIPLFNPIFASCFRRAINVSIAMESRCYGAPFKRTSLYENKLQTIDIIAILLVVFISYGVLLCNFIEFF